MKFDQYIFNLINSIKKRNTFIFEHLLIFIFSSILT